MATSDFQIIFDKLADTTEEFCSETGGDFISEDAQKELEDIAELGRLSSDLAMPDVTCYTTT